MAGPPPRVQVQLRLRDATARLRAGLLELRKPAAERAAALALDEASAVGQMGLLQVSVRGSDGCT